MDQHFLSFFPLLKKTALTLATAVDQNHPMILSCWAGANWLQRGRRLNAFSSHWNHDMDRTETNSPYLDYHSTIFHSHSHYAICCWYHHSHYVDQYKYMYIYIKSGYGLYVYIYIIYIKWLWLQTHDSAQWGFINTDPRTPSVCSGKAHGSPPPPEIWRFCQPRRSPKVPKARAIGVTPWQLESCSNCGSKIHKHKNNLKQNDKVFFKTVPLCLYNYGLSMVLWGRCEVAFKWI
jgi:hypothetical protein